MLTGKNKGFTLIELITVMVILGVLSAYAVPKLFDFSATAHVKTRDQFKVEVRSALRMYGLQQLASAGTKSYPDPSTMTISTLLDEESSEFTYAAALSSSGHGDFRYSGDTYYFPYSTSGSSFTLGAWASGTGTPD